MSKNSGLFWSSYPIFTRLLRDPANEELWEKIYEKFKDNNFLKNLTDYSSIKWHFNIKDVKDIGRLFNIEKEVDILKKEQELNKISEKLKDYENFKENYYWNTRILKSDYS